MAPLPLVGMPADTYENNGLYFHSLGDKYVRAVADVSKCLPVMIPSLGEALDIDAALGVLNLEATEARDFFVEPITVRPGVQRSVDCEYFRLEHLTPTARAAIAVPASGPHCLHVLAGAVLVERHDGADLGVLARGESALVPALVGAYRVIASEEPALVVRVEVPPYAA